MHTLVFWQACSLDVLYLQRTYSQQRLHTLYPHIRPTLEHNSSIAAYTRHHVRQSCAHIQVRMYLDPSDQSTCPNFSSLRVAIELSSPLILRDISYGYTLFVFQLDLLCVLEQQHFKYLEHHIPSCYNHAIRYNSLRNGPQKWCKPKFVNIERAAFVFGRSRPPSPTSSATASRCERHRFPGTRIEKAKVLLHHTSLLE